MTIYVHYQIYASPGYVPRPALRLYNVAAVESQGPQMVRVRMQFTDDAPTHDHVARVVIEPDTEDRS